MIEPFLISRPCFKDSRGSFEKIFDKEISKSLGSPDFKIKQINRSHNTKKGTLRGLHFQTGQFSENKVISVLSGQIIDYVVDIDGNSKNFGRVWSYELSAGDNQSLYIPRGYAHGFQTLQDNTDILYLHDQHYVHDNEDGINILDPKLGINLRLEISNRSERDISFNNLIGEV